MLLVKRAKVGTYVRYAEAELVNASTIWKVIFNDGGRVAVSPEVNPKGFCYSCPPTLLLCEHTEIIKGAGTKEDPFVVK